MLKALAAALALTLAASLPAAAAAVAQDEGAAKPKASKPLKGKSYYGRRGGYSVKKGDVIGSSRDMDPSMSRYDSRGGLGNDFFFETPWSPHGGNTVYMH